MKTKKKIQAIIETRWRQRLSLLAGTACLAFTSVAMGQFDPDSIQCDGVTGLLEPLPLCTPSSPCAHEFGPDITTATRRPLCITLEPSRPTFVDYPPLPFLDGHGTLHYACVYRHPDASSTAQRPLLLAFHGGEAGADFVYNYTSLRERAEDFDLTGDPLRDGFHLISVQGRNIHYPTGLPPYSREGSHHDFYFRDFSVPSGNPDVEFIDYLIDALVAQGEVDPARIYTIGHSNGGFMAQAYAFERHETATAGGSRVAAAAVFGAGDPFHNIIHGFEPSCQRVNYPDLDLPLYIVQRNCDSQNACDINQNISFGNPPGHQFVGWLLKLRDVIQDNKVQARLIDEDGFPVFACEAKATCSAFQGVINHVTWPDGINDASGIDWESGMLVHFKNNPHPDVLP